MIHCMPNAKWLNLELFWGWESSLDINNDNNLWTVVFVWHGLLTTCRYHNWNLRSENKIKRTMIEDDKELRKMKMHFVLENG